jgi:hypothetical protein
MQPFTRFAPRGRSEPPLTNRPDPSVLAAQRNRTFMPTPAGAILSRGVSIKGSVKFLNELLIDGEVEGTIDSTGMLTIGGARAHMRRDQDEIGEGARDGGGAIFL